MAASRPPNRTILIVEGDAVLRDALREMLSDCGYVTHAAADEADAAVVLAMMRSPPCFILRDVEKPVVVETLIQEIERHCGPVDLS